MVCCDHTECEVEWYHYTCMGLDENYEIPDNGKLIRGDATLKIVYLQQRVIYDRKFGRLNECLTFFCEKGYRTR